MPLSESLAAARPHPFVQRAIRAWPTFRWACAQPAHRPLTALSDSPAACADAWAVAVDTLIAVLTPSDLADALEPSAGLDVATRCAAVSAPPPLQSAMAVAAAVAAVDVPHGQFSREAAARSESGSGAAMVAAEPFEGICLADELPPAEAMRRAEAHAESAADESTAAQCRLDVLQRSAPLEGTSGNAVCGAVVEAGLGSVLVGWETGIGLTVQPSASCFEVGRESSLCRRSVGDTMSQWNRIEELLQQIASVRTELPQANPPPAPADTPRATETRTAAASCTILCATGDGTGACELLRSAETAGRCCGAGLGSDGR